MRVNYPATSGLLPNKTYPVMFTRGRVHKQKTLKYLPDSLRQILIVVTSQCEAKDLLAAYKAEHDFVPMVLLVFPDEYRLVRKRYLTVKWLQSCGADRFMFMDDDLALSVLMKEGRYKSARVDPAPNQLFKAWNKLDRLWTRYHGIGVSASSRNNYNFIKPETLVNGSYVHENTKSGGFFGYEVKKFLKCFAFAEEHELLQDIAYIDLLSNIITLNEQGRICRVYDIAWATEFDVKKESGGMNVYRNARNNGVAFLLMLLLLPGAFSRKEGSEDRFDDMIHINRHAWTPVLEWKEAKITQEVWMDSVYTELKFLGVSGQTEFEALFHSKKAGKYAGSLMRKLQAFSGQGGTTMEISSLNPDLPTMVNFIRNEVESGRAVKLVGDPSNSKVTSKAACEFIAEVNRRILYNWRVQPSKSPSLDNGLRLACQKLLDVMRAQRQYNPAKRSLF